MHPLAPRKRVSQLVDVSACTYMERYVHLECGLCGERLYTDLCEFTEGDGSQPHLSSEIYTNVDPDRLASLTDVMVRGCKKCSFNCSQNCHPRLFLIDAGTGIIDRQGYKYAIACGSKFVRVVEVPKVAKVLTVAAVRDICSSVTLRCTSVSGECVTSVVVDEPQKAAFGQIRSTLVGLLELDADTLAKFVREDGALLGKDYDDLVISDIFDVSLSA